MALSIFCILLSLLATLTCASTNDRQTGHQDAPGKETRIAIIGAGLSGSSTAYHLRKNAPPDQPLSITIFESSESIGGRVASFPVPDTQNRTILETGAASFFTDDTCITQSVEKLGLTLLDKKGCWSLLGCLYNPFRRTGIWNGKEIIGKPLLALRLSEWLDEHGLLWIVKPVVWSSNMSVWDTLRLLHWNDLKLDPGLQASCDFTFPSIWRRIHMRYEYGSSPALFRRAVHTTAERFQHFGRTDRFSRVDEQLRRVGLNDDIAKLSAADYLTGLGISRLFQSEVIEPCVRARSSLDLTQVSAIDAMVACRESKETSLVGGNIRLVGAMINASLGDLQLRSEVVGIEHGQDRRYKLSIADASDLTLHENHEFDVVVLAGLVHESPLLDSLQKLGSLPKNLLSPPSYTSAHVTYFATEHAFRPEYLNLSADFDVPDRLLTTSAESSLISLSMWDDMGFYWEDRLRRKEPWVERPDHYDSDECGNRKFEYENLYRVVSLEYISEGELAAMIGKDWEEGQNATDIGFSWVHRQEWSKAFPKFDDGRGVTGDLQVAEGVFWLGGGNEVTSSLEMSCKMGRNVVALIRDRATTTSARHGEL
ncbi:uncharacterized protein J4E87_008487 [Alternaria ethzedia]|uniref:uncharacterized protein n=1 Tax=Alternaria ethzedia TaxID=181014 RepID=UPI0020C28B1C|nr:uncharacterized protein J4E87_008487 [Alternaria ethzedia]KAI4616975.1 hypothetical protein J4E87_008487 [Alternaria ethzedia]